MVLVRRVTKRKKRRRVGKNRKGFSLIELIIVVAILGILVGVVVVNGAQFTRPAKIKTWQSSMQSMKEALMLAVSVSGSGTYPAAPASATNVNTWLTTYNASKYLDKPIVNPFWPKEQVGIAASVSATNKIDQDTDPGTGVNARIGYAVSSITDMDGNTVANGKFTLTYYIGSTAYTVTSSQ